MKETTSDRSGRVDSALLGLALLVGVLALLVATGGLLGSRTQAQGLLDRRTPSPGGPPDAQSTTGPTPPPGVDAQGVTIASATALVIPGVPAYIWHHGCGPTAAGMVIGYWDGQGFDALVAGDAHTQTIAVNEMIASDIVTPSHYSDYSLPIDSYPNLLDDRSELPVGDEHPDNCVADYMHTSQSYHYNYYGWSWFSHVGPAMENYVASVGHPDYYADASNLYMFYSPQLTWDNFRAEIDAGRPVVLLVDTDADGNTDHFVTAIGYDLISGTPYYGCLNTWDADIHWFEFAPMAPGQYWGVYGAVTLRMLSLDEHLFCPLVLRDF